MSSNGLKNITLKLFRKFLENQGCKQIRTTDGHEVWSRKDLLRPIIVQTHVKIIPEFIIKNNLKTLGVDRNEFIEIIKSL